MLLLLFICGLTAAGAADCPVDTNPSSAFVEYGDSFKANCSRLSDQVDGMGWESSLGGVSLKQGVSFVLLNIPVVNQWDFSPGCFVNLVDDNQCERLVAMTVYKTPGHVSMSEETAAPTLVEGRNHDLKCLVKNVAPMRNLQVSWHLGNKVLKTETFEDDSTKSPSNISSSITLTANRGDAGAEIWCEAKLMFGATAPPLPATRSKRVQLQVLYPPTFASPETEEELEFSSTVNMTLNCTATGNPPPVYTWKFPYEVQQTTEQKHKNEAVVTPVHQAEGTYVCTASNSQGRVVKTFRATQKPTDRTILIAVISTVGVVAAVGGGIVAYKFVKKDGCFGRSSDVI